MRHLNFAAALALALGVPACASPRAIELAPDVARAVEAAAAADSAAGIKADLAFLADDARAGRETGTAGYLEAARYVAARFDGLGLRPGADGGWFQEIAFRAARRNAEAARLALVPSAGGRVELAPIADFLIGRSLKAAQFGVVAPGAFVGYGVSRPEAGYDDYAGIDVAGKIVVAFSGAPASFDSEERAHYAGGETKQEAAVAHGAVGFISMLTEADEGRNSWERILENVGRPALAWIGPDGAIDPKASPVAATALLSAAGAAKLFQGSAKSYDELRALQTEGRMPRGFSLAGAVEISGASTFERISSPNVVAIIEGTDPSLKREAVVLSAHLDHVGVGEPKEAGEDVIHNGALDNAMGVAILLDVAERLAAAPPRRSVVILAVTAEEKGLRGADYFAHFPGVGNRRIVADVNLDMPLMLYPFTDVIAFGAERSTLGEAVAAEAGAMGLALSPDPFPQEGVFTRSDHYMFVRRGVPAVYLFAGFQNGGEAAFADFFANRYHKPSDDLSQPILYDQAARFAELNFRIARRVANADAAPIWREGDFFGELYGGGR